MLGVLTSSGSVLHYKKLTADAAAGSGLAVVNDQSILVLNLLIIVGRIVIELIIKAREKKNEKG